MTTHSGIYQIGNLSFSSDSKNSRPEAAERLARVMREFANAFIDNPEEGSSKLFIQGRKRGQNEN